MAATNGSANGTARSKDKVRVAIIGVGNCANSLLQGVEYYKDASPEDAVPGLMSTGRVRTSPYPNSSRSTCTSEASVVGLHDT